jgi:hypothetical protein
MQHTVVAVFDDFDEAERAKRELIDEGFDEGSVQLGDHASFDTSSTAAPRAGATSLSVIADDAHLDAATMVLERHRPIDLRGGDDPYRRHWRQNYALGAGAYDDFEPAYRYGSRSATDTRYRGMAWDSAETNLKSEWEEKHPGSAWERFKGAIRYAWDRVTGKPGL